MHKTITRILLFLLAFMIVFSCIYSVFAAGISEEDMTAASILLMQAETGSVLYEKEADARRAPASTTKLLTAVLALENMQLDDEVTVPPEAQTNGSNMGLKPGQVVTVETLLYGLMLSSGNDAAVTLAIAIAGTVEAFSAKMNEKAAELGMDSSHFVTASGQDSDEHYVTVRDMARLAVYAYGKEELRTIMKTGKTTRYTVDKSVSFPLENTNLLVHTPTEDEEGKAYSGASYLYEYATGMKTGSTRNAAGCLIASAEKDGETYIALIFGDDSSGQNDRWRIATKLFKYAFANYKSYSLSELIGGPVMLNVVGGPIVKGEAKQLACVPVSDSGSEKVTLSADADLSGISYTVTSQDSAALNAPIAENTPVGEIEIRQGDKVLWTGKLVAAEAMMTAEEYAKLSGTQAEASNLLNLDSERRQQLRKYAWLWLLIPACGVAFFLWRGLRGNRRSYQKYRGPRQTRHVRSPHPTIHRQRAEAVPTRMPRAARSGMRQPSVRRQEASGSPVRTSQTIARRSKPVQSGAMRPHVRRRSRG